MSAHTLLGLGSLVLAPSAARKTRIAGLSAAALMLAGTALVPAQAQVADLGGLTVSRNDFQNFPSTGPGVTPSEITNGLLRINPLVPQNFAGDLTDSLGVFSLTKFGAGTLTLSGVSTYSGNTSVQGGTLIVGSATAISTSSRLSVTGSATAVSTVDLNGFDVTALNLTGNGTGVVTNSGAAATLTVNATLNTVFNGALQGNLALVKTGTGTLDLGNLNTVLAPSNFTGGVTLQSGSLRVGSDVALGTGDLTVAGASSFGTTSNAPRTIANNIVLNNDLTVLTPLGRVLTLDGVISGSGRLIKQGVGLDLTLNGANSYTGGTTLSGGQLIIGNNLALGTGAVTQTMTSYIAMANPGGSITLANDFIHPSSGLQISMPDVGGVFTFTGAISGGADINLIEPLAPQYGTGGGTVALLGSNTITGHLRLRAAGTVELGSAAAVNSLQSIRVEADNTTIRILSDNQTITTGLSSLVGSHATTLDIGAFNTNFAGAIRDGGPTSLLTLFKTGSGILTVSNAGAAPLFNNSVSGGVFVTQGGLNLTGNLSGAIAMSSGTSLTGTGTQDTGTVTIADGATLSPGDALAGPNAIGKLSVGNLTLGGAATTIFDLGAPSIDVVTPVNDLVVVAGNLDLGGTFNFNILPGFTAGTYRLMTYGGALTGGVTLGVLPVGFNYTLNTGGGFVDLDVALIDFYWDGTGPFADGTVDGGSGTWNAGNTNWTNVAGTISTAWINGGRAFFTGTPGTVTVDGNFTYESLNFLADGYVLNGAPGATLGANAGTISVGDAINAVVNVDLVGTGGLTKNGNGTLVLGGNNSFTGGLTIATGTLAVTQAAALGADAVTINGTSVLRFDAGMTVANNIQSSSNVYELNTNGNDVTLTGSLLGGGAYKRGAGTLTLANAVNTQPGELWVEGGSLNITGAVQGAVQAFGGTSVTGTGAVAGNLTINNGATLSPGVAGAGTLTATNLVLAGASTSLFDLGTVNVVGGSNDLVAVDNNLTLGGTLNVNPLADWNIGTGAYRLFNYAGTLTDNGLALGGILTTPPAHVIYAIDTATAGQVNLTVSYAAGAAFNWDGNGAPVDGVIQGGAGTWNAAATNWTNSDGFFNLAYVDSTATTANFGGASGGGAVTVSGTRTVGTLNFTADGYVLGGGGDLLVDAGTVNVTAPTATINVAINGNSLTKTGAGNLVLGAANGYTGGTSLDDGTITVTNAGALGSGTLTMADGTTLAAGADGLTVANDIKLTGSSTIDTGANNFTLSGTLADALLSGGIFVGAWSVNQGPSWSGSPPNGPLAYTGREAAALLFGGSPTDYVISTAGTDPNLINNLAWYSIIGYGEAQFSQDYFSKYLGLYYGPTSGFGNNINNAASAYVADNSGGTNYAFRFAPVPAQLVKVGSGTLILQAANSYSGGTLLNAGNIQVENNLALGTGALTMADGTTLIAGVDGLNLANNVATLGNGTVDIGANVLTLSGIVSGAGAITKIGSGNLVLSGANSYAGGTNLNAGTISVLNDSALGTGTLTAADGTTLAAGTAPSQGGWSLANAVVLNGTLNVALNGTMGNVVTGDGNNLTFNGAISGAGGLSIAGYGRVTLNGDNSYAAGTQVTNAVVSVGSDTALGTGTLTLDNAGLDNSSGSLRTLGNAVALAGQGIVLGTNDITLNGNVSGPGLLTMAANSTLTLNGTNSYSGGTNLEAGTIVVGTNSALGTGLLYTLDGTTLRAGAAGLTIGNNIDVSGMLTIDSGAGLFTLTGPLDGIGAFTKVGSGELLLTGTGGIGFGGSFVNAGTLTVDGALINSGLQITVADGATINGSGSIAGLVTLNDGASLNIAGGNAGVFTLGNLSLSGGSILNFQLGAANTFGGPLNDRLVVTGDLVLDGLLNVTETVGGAFTLGIYNLISYGGVLTNNGLDVAGVLPNGLTGNVQINGAAQQVNLIVAGPNSIVLNWDGTDFTGAVPGGQGGNGVWNATNTNWTGEAPGEINATWQDNAIGIFGGAGGSVDVASAFNFGGLAFQADGYVLNDAGGSLNTNGTLGSFIGVDGGLTATINATIGGSGDLYKQGAGTLVLGGNNTLTGNVNLQNGTLAVTSNGALGLGSLIFTGGTTLRADASVSLANAMVLNGLSTVDTNGNTLTLGGVLSGAGLLSKDGAGTLVLNGANSYAGGTWLNSGTIVVGNNTALGTGTLSMFANTTLAAGVDGLALGNAIVAGPGSTIDTGAFTFTLNGTISGFDVTKTGSGNLVLNGNNSYTGGTALTAGTITVGTSTALGAGTLTMAGGTTLAAGADGLNVGNAVVTNGAGTVDTGANSFTLSGVVSGAGSIDKVGSGNLILTNGNVYAGGTNLDAGTITVVNNAALGTGALTMADGTTLAAGANGLNVGNNINMSGNNTIDTGANTFTLSGTLADAVVAGGLFVGSWQVDQGPSWSGSPPNGPLAYTGQEAAALLFGGQPGDYVISTAGNNPSLINNLAWYSVIGYAGNQGNGGSLLPQDYSSKYLGLYYGPTSGFASQDPNAAASAYVSDNASGATFTNYAFTAGGVPGTLVKIGSGTLILQGSNTYSGGTLLNVGTIQVENNNALGTGALTMADGTTLKAGLNNLTVANNVVTLGNGTVDTGANVFTLSGTISGAGAITKIGSGNLVLSGANSYAGGTALNQGTISVLNNSALGTGTLTAADGTTLSSGTAAGQGSWSLANAVVLNGTLNIAMNGTTGSIDDQGNIVGADGNDLTLNGTVSGAGGLVVGGFGRLTLNGTNSYAGGTVVNFAAVYVGTDSALGTGALTLNDGVLANNSGSLRTLANAVVLAGDGTVLGPNDITLNGVVSGTGNLTKKTTSTLTLNGANSYGGGTDFFGGTIVVGNSGALGTGSLNVEGIGQATTLKAGVDALALANAINLNPSSNLVVDSQAFNFTLNGGIFGPGALTKVGSGNLSLNGNSGYAGGTALNAGSITVGTSTALGTGLLTMQDGTSLIAGVGGLNLLNDVAINGNSTVNTNGLNLRLSGVISGAGTLVKTGGGPLFLSGTNTYIGGTNVGSGGAIIILNNSALGTGAVTLNNDSALVAGLAATTIGNDIITLGNGFLNSGANVFTVNGVVSGAGNITKTGSGTLVLNGANTYTGGTFLNAGTIRVGNNSALGTGALAMAAGTILQAGAPTLTIGNAIGMAGGATVDVNGTVLTLGGVISGTGPLSVIDSQSLATDALILTGVNTYTGGTVVTGTTVQVSQDANLGNVAGGITLVGGTLRTTASFSTARTVALGTGGGSFDVATGTTLTSTGVISGTSLTKLGGGTLALNAANSYTGGTTLTAGTISVGTNSALGTGALAMAGGTTLAAGANNLALANLISTAGVGTVDTGTNNFTLNGVISGAGSIAKAGSGNLTLNAANSYTGGTALNAGAITVGNGSALGTGALTMADGTSLVAGVSGLTVSNAITTLGAATINSGASPSVFTLSGVISGAGSVTKQGTGLLTLSGASTYTGTTTVAAGILNVTGSLVSGVTVNSGASLTGGGTIGALNVLTGGTVNPGGPGTTDSATLTVTGAATLAGTYIANVTPSANDRITAGGALTLGGTLAVQPTGTYTIFNQVITVASGASRTGTFSTVTGLGQFGLAFAPVAEYTATQANIRMAPNSLVAIGNLYGGLNGNPLEVAQAFDRAVALGYNPQAFFAVYANAGSNLSRTLREMSGEQRATERRVVLESNRVVRESALDRLNLGLAAMGGQQVSADKGDGKLTFWLRAAGSWGKSQTSGAATGFRTEQLGLLTGIDWSRDNLKLGGMFHYTTTDVTFSELGGTSRVETMGGALYAGWREQDAGFVVNGGVSVAGARTSGARAITLPSFAQTLTGRTTGTTYQVFGELAYDLAKSANTRIEPFVRNAYVTADMNSLTETGGVAALAAPKQSYNINVFNAGMRVATTVHDGKYSLNASAAWQRTSGGRDANTFIGVPAVGQFGNIRSVAIDSDALLLQVGAGAKLSEKIRFGLNYSGLYGKNNDDHGARATLNIDF